MGKIIRLTETDLTRLVKRIIKEQNEPTPETNKKGIQDLLIKNGFQLQSQFNTPTYTKVVPNKGEFSFVVMSTDPVVNFYAKNPSQDMIQSLLLKPMGDEVWYTDSEGKINRGYPYYSSFW